MRVGPRLKTSAFSRPSKHLRVEPFHYLCRGTHSIRAVPRFQSLQKSGALLRYSPCSTPLWASRHGLQPIGRSLRLRHCPQSRTALETGRPLRAPSIRRSPPVTWGSRRQGQSGDATTPAPGTKARREALTYCATTIGGIHAPCFSLRRSRRGLRAAFSVATIAQFAVNHCKRLRLKSEPARFSAG